jgi:ferric hydroxamate transport system substrate-binding protein
MPNTVIAERYQITDTFGKHQFDHPPQNIVVTDWTVLENLLELGIVPLGAPELDRYRQYVVQPKLPTMITDIGKRMTPNLATVKSLNPDVVILGTKQRELARAFSLFARVNYYNSFSPRYRTNGTKSRKRFLQIAQLVQKVPLAEKKLAFLDTRIAELKKQLSDHFGQQLPFVTTCRFSAKQKLLLYGRNSMPDYALGLLGIEDEYQTEVSTWGETEVSISALKEIKTGYLICFKPHDDASIFNQNNWRKLSLVQQDRFHYADPVWSYGGAMSVLYIAEAVTKTLLNL